MKSSVNFAISSNRTSELVVGLLFCKNIILKFQIVLLLSKRSVNQWVTLCKYTDARIPWFTLFLGDGVEVRGGKATAMGMPVPAHRKWPRWQAEREACFQTLFYIFLFSPTFNSHDLYWSTSILGQNAFLTFSCYVLLNI